MSTHRTRSTLHRHHRASLGMGVAVVAMSLTATTIATATDEAAEAPEIPDVLVLTPSQQEGPFYPVELPDDHDPDLTLVVGADGPAAGEPLHLEGLLLSSDGTPVEGALVEIWQTDASGVYLHPGDPDFADRDTTFQGYGSVVTDAAGAWAFRTILPEVYGGRPRHIHAKVGVADETVLTTQIYFSGGDVPEAGAVDLTGADTDRLVVEALRRPDADGAEVLHAQHLIVIP